MPKAKCIFTENLKAEYSFINEDQHVGKVFCTIRKSLFSIEHISWSDILQHNKKKKPLDCCKQYELQSYFSKETITDEDKHIAAEEGLFAFHTTKHNHSFRSMDCTFSVIRNLHVQKFSCGQTKCEAIAVNVLAPFAMQQILEELETLEYISVMVET
jgi:hypothetical protein